MLSRCLGFEMLRADPVQLLVWCSHTTARKRSSAENLQQITKCLQSAHIAQHGWAAAPTLQNQPGAPVWDSTACRAEGSSLDQSTLSPNQHAQLWFGVIVPSR